MADNGKADLTLEALPEQVLADEPVSIKVSGFPHGERVTLSARTEDGGGSIWNSHAVFVTGPDGTIDTGRDAPEKGNYQGADPWGLFRSMHPKEKVVRFVRGSCEPQSINLEASGNSGTVKANLELIYRAEGVNKVTLGENGLKGSFFAASGDAPRPGVLLLHGTIARVMEDIAAMLASRGFPTAVPLYYGSDGLPPEYMRIPLEYFGTALDWLGARPEVDSNRLAVIGLSRGGELALLAGSRFQTVKAVVSISGSGVVFNGLPANPRDSRVDTPWTYQGEPLPFVERKDSFGFVLQAIMSGFTGKPLSTLRTYENGMKDTAAVENATVEVEKINGPVLLVSGGADKVWPSCALSRIAADRLKANDHNGPVKQLVHEKAGHGFSLPYCPTTSGRAKPSPQGSGLDFGGEPEANAKANLETWKTLLDFLNSNL